jgi:hypothetical protein
MTRLLALVACLLLALSGAFAQGQRACVTVSPTSTAPVVDGILDDGAWDTCAVLGGLQTAGEGALAAPNTVVFITYDDRALYLGVRCVEPDPARPAGFVRAHDDEVYADDCVQVFVAPEDLRRTKAAAINFGGYAGAYSNWYADIQAYYEFSVNGLGSTSEARNDVRDWDGAWEAKVARWPGAWTAEIAIPLATLGVDRAPQDALWGLNLFRGRAPQFSGWVYPGFGGYTPLPLGAMRLAGAHAVARLTTVEPPVIGRNTLELSVRNTTGAPVEADVTVTPAGGAPVTGTVTVPADDVRGVSVRYTIGGEGDLRTRYEARLRGEDAPLLSGSIPLQGPGRPSGEVRYFSLTSEVEGLVHLPEAGAGAEAEGMEALLTLQPATGEAVTASAPLAGTQGTRLTLPVTGAVGDTFSARLQALDAAGRVVLERTCEIRIPARPDWLGARQKITPGVLPPWTPVKVTGRRVEVLGREISYTDLALPASIRSAGAELLAAPMRVLVEANGREVKWTSRRCNVTDRSTEGVEWASIWESDQLELAVVSNVEYDGFTWNEVTLVPRGTVRVDRVALDIPLRREVAKLVYQGHAQAAGALSPFGLRRGAADNLWLGNEERGLAWQAESLEWVQAKDTARQVEVTPGDHATLWRTNFIDTPTDLSAPYTAKFALTPTPTKPVSLRKSRIYHAAEYGMEDKHAGGTYSVPAKGLIDLERGTLEAWVRPTFDTYEVYAPDRDLSAYNRVVLTLPTGSGQVVILYYNADDRNFRLLLVSGPGQYKLIMTAPGHLPANEWSYLGLSWGDKVRLTVNGQTAEADLPGLVSGDLGGQNLQLDLGYFQVDDLRISRTVRPVEQAPAAALSKDADTLFLNSCEDLTHASGCASAEGKFGKALGSDVEESLVDRLAREGQRIVIYHESWSRYQGLPDLEQIPKLRKIADACHARGMRFLVYFCQLMSDAAPVWKGLENDFMALPERNWYHREDVKQDCRVSCVNGPYGDLLLDGIAKLADGADIDGVYMDGTTVPWDCVNPTHPGCGQYQGDGTYLAHNPIRATREFMKRLRAIFVQRGKDVFLDAHTGGAINTATQSFCDGYYDGEHLARYKPGYRMSPATYATAYMGKQFGFRGEFLPNRYTADQALAVALVHDTAFRGQPYAVDRAFGDYEDAQTRFIGYWEKSPLYTVEPARVLGSLYLKPDRALLALGNQTEQDANCRVSLRELLKALPTGVTARDAVTHEALPLNGTHLRLEMPGRSWRLVELSSAGASGD